MSRNMPGRPRKLPSYCHHKASGQAVVRIDGKDRYLGPYGSPASYEKYHRLISERFPHGPDSSPLSHPSPGRDLTMIELMAGYWQHVVKYYVKNDKPTSEQNSIRAALKPIKELYGHEFCHRFGPLALRTVRNKMIDDGITRTRINQHVGRIRRMFKWAVANELLGVETYQTLTALDGLSKGRSDAKESDPVKPVPIEHVEAVLPFLTPQVRAMVQLQRFLACRPEEVARIRPCDVDRSIDPWVYTPETHTRQNTMTRRGGSPSANPHSRYSHLG